MDTLNHRTSFSECLLIMLLLLATLGYLIIGLNMTPHVPILFAFTLLLLYGNRKGYSWDEIHSGIVEGVSQGIVPIVIFLMIGALVATWVASGTIPTIMAYGLKIVSVETFLPAVFIVCALVGVTVGSSFTTISTMGIAFMGIGSVMGFHEAMIAGAIVSGAFLGNNISPLSDTTNLASSIGGVNLFKHIENMAWSAVPAALLTVLGYAFIASPEGKASITAIAAIRETLSDGFFISPVTLIPVGILFVFAWSKIPAIPTLLSGAISAIIIYLWDTPGASVLDVSAMVMNGYVAHTGSIALDSLLSRGGIMSMLGAASLIILALALGGLLVKFNIVQTLIARMTSLVNTPGRLITSTAIGAILINLLVGEQYLSMILPGETFKNVFEKIGLDMKYLTRTLADAGAVVNSLIPWGVSGTFIAGALKVNAVDYLSYSFYPLLAPIITIALAFTVRQKSAKNL